MKPGPTLVLLAALWLLSTAAVKVDRKIVDADRVMAVAEWQVTKALDSSLCQMAFRKHMPDLDDDWDLRRTWDDQVQFVIVEWMIGMPTTRAATNCDVSTNTFVISRGYSGWGGIKDTKEAMIHEFVHLLRCPTIISECGVQANCAPLFLAEEERMAYSISRVCRDAS